MLHGQKISLVMPTLNEAEGIRSMIEAAPKAVDEIIVVDGGSSDNTCQIAAECGAIVVLEKRRGYGRAYKSGFEHCTGQIVATCDGDGTYPVAELERLINHLIHRELDFISCSRLPLIHANSMNYSNFIGNYMITQAASLLWGHQFSDILSGMWVSYKDFLMKMPLLSDNWNFSEEIKLKAYAALGSKFSEIHVPYYPRLGETKLMRWKVGLENIIYMLQLRSGFESKIIKEN